MAEADDIQKLLRLVENTLNFDLRFVVILVVGKSNHIIWASLLWPVFKYWSVVTHRRNIDWFSEELEFSSSLGKHMFI